MKTKLLTLLALLVLTVGSASLAAKQKPFLIQGKMPHLTMLVNQNWNNESFGLTTEQKTKLKSVKQRTMGGVTSLRGEIFPLEASIVKASANGATPTSLEEDVKKLAELRAAATIQKIF